MSYEIDGKEVDIPEVDAFLADYKTLCERHGMQLETRVSECMEQFNLASAIIEKLRERDSQVRWKFDKNCLVLDRDTL